MSGALTLANLFDDAAIFSLEHQLHLEEVLGDHDYEIDLEQPRFAFTGDRPITCTGLHLLGSAAPGPRSWLWGWANPSGYPRPVTAASAAVRDFGRRFGIAELASAEVPFDALPGSPTEPAMVTGMLTDAAKAVTGLWTSYNIHVGGGTRAGFLIEHPSFPLPPPEPSRVLRVISQAIAELPLTDHRRALHAYASHRRLGADFGPTGATLTGPDFAAAVRFDALGRVTGIDATLFPPGTTETR